MNAIGPTHNKVQNYTANTKIPSEKQNSAEMAAATKYQDTVSISFQAQQKMANEQVSDTTSLKSPDPLAQYRYGGLNTYDNLSFLEKVNQALIDKRTGLDREKVEEINKKMEAIINDDSIPPESKEEMLSQLAAEKEEEFRKAAEKMREQAKAEDKKEHHEQLS